MTISRSVIEKLHMNQLEHLARIIEAREAKSKHIATRRKWLERQTSANYRNEYDRIRGDLQHYKLGSVDKRKLENRQKELQQLFSSSMV
jgi:hypothetical protein